MCHESQEKTENRPNTKPLMTASPESTIWSAIEQHIRSWTWKS